VDDMACIGGSLVNYIQSRSVIGAPEPFVGMPATILFFSDREPATVIEIFELRKAKHVVLQADDYKRVDNNGLSESQEYVYTANPNGSKYTFRMARNGLWKNVFLNAEGKYERCGETGLYLGKRERYYDFSF